MDICLVNAISGEEAAFLEDVDVDTMTVLQLKEAVARAYRPRNVATVPGPFALEHGGVLEGPLSVVWEQWGEPRLPAARTVVVLPSFSHGAQKKHSADCYLSI